jgi:hypothetical protein
MTLGGNNTTGQKKLHLEISNLVRTSGTEKTLSACVHGVEPEYGGREVHPSFADDRLTICLSLNPLNVIKISTYYAQYRNRGAIITM